MKNLVFIFVVAINISNAQDSSIVGYFRMTEVSFCMDECSMYYLEDEFGTIVSNISNQNNIQSLDRYLNRFVQIEGESIQCVECEAINITSITFSQDCQVPVYCPIDPCLYSNCYSNNSAECVANYCGGCYSDYYNNIDGELIYCEPPPGVVDLTGIDFGDCDMALGVGWVNNRCQPISGCGWVADSINYFDAFFTTEEECLDASMLDTEKTVPSKYYLEQNYPNPFNPTTKIVFFLPKELFVDIRVYNMLGRIINHLVYDVKNSGSHSIIWDGTNDQGKLVSPGIYFYRFYGSDFIQTRKMILLN